MTIKFTDDFIKQLVDIEHFKHGKSLRMIERENGMSNDTIRKRCMKLGIKTRSRIDSIHANQKHVQKITGDNHWRAKNKEASERLSVLHSENMKKNNPSHNPEIKKKIIKSLAATLAANPTFHEKMFYEFLKSNNISFEYQQIIGSYIVDFLIDDVVIELDGRGHASRLASDRIRDKALNDRCFHVVRVNQDCLFNKRAKIPKFRPFKFISIIENLIPSLNVVNSLIPDGGKYRVVFRESYTGTEIIY